MPEPSGPKPPVPGLLQLRSNFTVDGAKWSTGFHVLKSIAAAWAGADILAVLANLASALAGDILPLYGAAVHNSNNVAIDLSSAMGLEETGSGGGSGTGSGTNPLPISVALRTSFPVPLRYRGGRPGMAWAGLDQADRMASSVTMWSNSTEANWIGAVEALMSSLTGFALPSGATCKPVSVSYFSGFAFRPVPLTFPITSPVQIQQRICSRRKRLGRGVPGE